jgi:hypothetical protein
MITGASEVTAADRRLNTWTVFVTSMAMGSGTMTGAPPCSGWSSAGARPPGTRVTKIVSRHADAG